MLYPSFPSFCPPQELGNEEMKPLANVFFASPDFSGLTPLVLLIPLIEACLPLYIVAAFHGQSPWLALLQCVLIVSVQIIQWRRFRRLSVSFRAFATFAIFIAINFVSNLAIFCLFRLQF